MNRELEQRHAAAIAGGAVVLDGPSANLVAWLLRLTERMFQVEGPEALVERLRLPSDNAAILLDAMAAFVSAAEGWQEARASADFRAETASAGELVSSGACVTSSVPAAAELLGLSARRIRQLAAAGMIEGTRGPNGWRLDRISVEALARERAAA